MTAENKTKETTQEKIKRTLNFIHLAKNSNGHFNVGMDFLDDVKEILTKPDEETFKAGCRWQKMMTPDIEPFLARFDPHTLLIAATRYYTGRMTIATSAFAEELAKAWDDIPEKTRNIIIQDLEIEFRHDDAARERGADFKPLGADCDRAAWEKVREKYK